MSMISCDYYLINPHNNHVGVITKKGKYDTSEFKPCIEEKIFPYYYGRSPSEYTKGKNQLRKHILENHDNHGYIDISGYITVRFIINCEGQIGYFKVEQVTTDFKEVNFPNVFVDNIVELIKLTDSWKPLEFNDLPYDSFFHITLKIGNGDVLEVLP